MKLNFKSIEGQLENLQICRKQTTPFKMTDKMVKLKIIKKIRKYLKTSKNENPTFQNLWDAVKGVPREKFIAMTT
jgi:hypothetical protein